MGGRTLPLSIPLMRSNLPGSIFTEVEIAGLRLGRSEAIPLLYAASITQFPPQRQRRAAYFCSVEAATARRRSYCCNGLASQQAPTMGMEPAMTAPFDRKRCCIEPVQTLTRRMPENAGLAAMIALSGGAVQTLTATQGDSSMGRICRRSGSSTHLTESASNGRRTNSKAAVIRVSQASVLYPKVGKASKRKQSVQRRYLSG